MINLDLDSTPVFEKNFDSEKRIVINRGGTRSSKTYSLAQLSVLFLFTGYVKPGIVLNKGVMTICRKWSVTLDGTVIRDFEDVLNAQNLYQHVTHNKTKKTYKFGNRLVEFIGVDTEQKVRGAKRDILYCNEANELTYEEFKQLNRRTLHRIYLDFNPDDEEVWINKELEQKRALIEGDVDVFVSTYKDNTFLEPEIIKEIELEAKTDPDSWQVYGLGEYGKIKGRILNNWEIVPAIPDDAKLIGYGMDFGFTNDPTAMVEVFQQSGELWVRELIYHKGLTNPMISEHIEKSGVKKHETIIADSAEPKSIQEIYNLGWNIKPAKKGPDSIKNSIDILKRYKINVTASSENLIKELKRWKWEVDKNGNTLNEPMDKYNHAIDALRYLALNMLGETNHGRYAIR